MPIVLIVAGAFVAVALAVLAGRAVGLIAWPLSRRMRIVVPIAPFVIVAAVYGAILVYTNIINDPDPALGTEDLSAVFAPDDTVAAASTVSPNTTTVDSADPGTAAPDPGSTSSTDNAAGSASLDGVWDVDAADPDTTFGYRVQEVLGGVDATATGRSSDITGSITIDGTDVTDGSFTVQVASITSDKTNRDRQFAGRIMQTDDFPTATFTLTAPIALGAIPADGEQVTAPTTGDLTLHGVTNPVTFDVTAQTDGGTIGVLGSIPIAFADYGIDNPSGGVVTTEDHGLLEFVLVFVPVDPPKATGGADGAGTASGFGRPSDVATGPVGSDDTGAGCSSDATTSSVPPSTGGPDTIADSDRDDAGLDGDWTINDKSEFGYRVDEVLAGVDATATGRSNEIGGSITIDAATVTAGCFVVEVASITSDQNNRDAQFRGQVMDTDDFPEATFVLTQPIDLGELPDADEQVTATATGELTMHGVTNTVTFDVTAQTDGHQVGALGAIPIVFADYGIDNPSNGVVTTGDDGLLEFLLVFER